MKFLTFHVLDMRFILRNFSATISTETVLLFGQYLPQFRPERMISRGVWRVLPHLGQSPVLCAASQDGSFFFRMYIMRQPLQLHGSISFYISGIIFSRTGLETLQQFLSLPKILRGQK